MPYSRKRYAPRSGVTYNRGYMSTGPSYYSGPSVTPRRARQVRKKKYNAKIQKILANHKSKIFRTSRITTLNSVTTRDTAGFMLQIPQYSPTGASPTNLVSATRTHDRVYVKGLTVRFCATTSVETTNTQPVMLRVILLWNNAPEEPLVTATLSNLFEDTNKADQAPSTTTSTLYVQKVNEDLYKGSKAANVWLDKKLVLGRSFTGQSVEPNALTKFTKYIKINRLIEFETDAAGTTVNKTFPYFCVMVSTPTATIEGSVLYHAEFDCHFVED